MSEPLLRETCDFFPTGQVTGLGERCLQQEVAHDDMELWEGVPFSELVLDRLSLYEQGKAAWKVQGCKCLSHKKRQGHVLA